jgi:hypothetical protein
MGIAESGLESYQNQIGNARKAVEPRRDGAAKQNGDRKTDDVQKDMYGNPYKN